MLFYNDHENKKKRLGKTPFYYPSLFCFYFLLLYFMTDFVSFILFFILNFFSTRILKLSDNISIKLADWQASNKIIRVSKRLSKNFYSFLRIPFNFIVLLKKNFLRETFPLIKESFKAFPRANLVLPESFNFFLIRPFSF